MYIGRFDGGHKNTKSRGNSSHLLVNNLLVICLIPVFVMLDERNRVFVHHPLSAVRFKEDN